MEDEFVISQSKLSLLREYHSHISSLFHVNLEALPTAGNVSAKCGSQVWIRVKSARLELSAQQQQQQDVQNAKEYILSLVTDDEASWTEKVFYNPDEFEVLERHHRKVEYNSRAVINLRRDQHSVQIHGQSMNIVLAQTYIDHLLKEHVSSQNVHRTASNETCLASAENTSIKSRGEILTDKTYMYQHSAPCLSPGADSCYGSSDDCLADSNIFSCPPPPPPRTPKAGVKEPHSVSPVAEPSSPPSSSQSGSGSESSPDPEQDKNYQSKIEFGVKLGYSEAQVVSVLNKLGINAPQNELLAELISLGTSKSPVIGEKDIEKVDSVTAVAGQPILSATKGMSLQSETPLLSGTDSDVANRLSAGSTCSEDTDTAYRPIVIDGSNVAMSHGPKDVFSCQGIKLAVDWFKNRGCKDITVFVPQWRKESSRPDAQIEDQHILRELEEERILSFTPARRISGKRMVCYDDRFILKLAAETDGIVVSNDNYRDLLAERGDFKKVVEERLLMYSFVRDMFMPPDDPLGRHGPSLENFLRKEPTEPEPIPPPCPYGKKCTYGNKCKYYHAERGNLPQISVTEKLAQQAKQHLQEVERRSKAADDKKKGAKKKRLLTRTDSSNVQACEEATPPPRPPRSPIMPAASASPHKDILETDVRENDADFKAYNEKLSELRKNIPLESSHKKVLMPNLDVEKTGHPSYLDPGQWSIADMSKARSSPQLVTGHLDLAKTLSDEANREQRKKSLRQQQEELKRDLKRNPDLPVYTSLQDEAELLHQGMDQLSLQTVEVPRSRGSPFSPESTQSHSSEGYHSREFVHGPFFSEPGNLQSFPYDHQERFLSDHEELARAHSGTPQAGLILKPPGPSNMNRQNSTSDPILNKHSVTQFQDYTSSKPGYGHFPNTGFPQRPSCHSPSFQRPQFMAGGYETGHYPAGVQQDYRGQNYPSPTPQPPFIRPAAGGMAAGGWPRGAAAHIPETGYPPDSPILPTDTRFALYYNLCSLFPEQYVRHVMNRYPQETNPRVICAHVVSYMNG